MNFDTLQLSFFDRSLATENQPFLRTEQIKYKKKSFQGRLAEVMYCNSFMEIRDKEIKCNNISLKINSTIRDGDLIIHLRINDISSMVSLSIKNSSFSGTIMVDDSSGFHYSLIASEELTLEIVKKMMNEREERQARNKREKRKRIIERKTRKLKS